MSRKKSPLLRRPTKGRRREKAHHLYCPMAASVGWAKARSAVPTSASTQTASQPWARFALPTLRSLCLLCLDVFRDARRRRHGLAVGLEAVDVESDRVADLLFHFGDCRPGSDAAGQVRHVGGIIAVGP